MKDTPVTEVWIGFYEDVRKAAKTEKLEKPPKYIGDEMDSQHALIGLHGKVIIHWCGQWWNLKEINGILSTIRHTSMFSLVEQRTHNVS